MKNILLTILILTNFTFASENYLGLYSTQVNNKELKDKYCKNNQKGDEFCMEYTLTYPIVLKTENLDLKKSIDEIIEYKKRKFKKLNAKNKVLSLLSDEPDLTWSWKDKTLIKLYATTKKSFTLAIINYNYSGGAHANQTVEYENYFIESGKNIEMKDLFVSGYLKKLKQIANRFYRESNNLSTKESLTKIGWYGDNFVLSDNFAITTKGLEFLYNPYEIKPYIAGITTFLLPNNRIRSIMKSDK
jgi:hypothetical protein